MATIIERARQVISAEDDDFFQAETIKYYVNKGQRKVVSYMVNQEQQLDRSLRALDRLKSVTNVTLTAGSAKDSYFTHDVDFPSGMNQFENLVYDDSTILRELSANKLYLLEWGNLVPTQYEGYYYVTNVAGTSTFRIYIHEDGDTNDVEIYYVSNPTDIGLTDETFTELPEQLENAVIYAAATMMASQELSEGTKLYSELYQEELKANVY